MNKKRYQDLELRIQTLLDDPAYAGHPLHGALADLWQHTNEQLERIERISYLSDAFQMMARQRELGLVARYDRELRRLAKLVRISDGYQELMRDMNAALRESSIRDPLTNLLNRRALMERMKELALTAESDRPAFVVAMLDVDHFKRINDRYGHDAGDRALTRLADVMRAAVRDTDDLARWGGEEFLALLPNVSLQEGEAVIDRIVAGVRGNAIEVDGEQLLLTVSVGIAQHRPGENVSTTLSRADRALYLAKQAGRDRVALERRSAT
ncbi:GGDEF domain-containing protein [Bordetella genomosp. 9]|uniref:biofilm regulation diguanylate cyclase SiaD n=1 Tax=Bordetella genomosp. 9 TaxID=1416803 RepID=UPI000A292EBF|nr:biofilm regulation diguanylate cyclase SiaD [Bordetella genomosp. 9]ARP91937.1 GGDEF domain-containing protein [Bordetella genomosp. 9]